jgi:hypothetical protein
MVRTPAINALPQSPAVMLRTAMCAATRLDEQAVSIAAAGPRRPKVYDSRPAATDSAEPARYR